MTLKVDEAHSSISKTSSPSLAGDGSRNVQTNGTGSFTAIQVQLAARVSRIGATPAKEAPAQHIKNSFSAQPKEW